MIVELTITIKEGPHKGENRKIKFEKFGEIHFGRGIKSVEDLSKSTKRQIEKMYEDIAKEIQEEIDSLKFTSKLSPTDSLKKYQLTELKNSLEKSLNEVTKKTQTLITAGMIGASKAVTEDMTAWLNKMGVKVKESYAYVPNDIVGNIVSGRLYGKNWTFSKRIWGDYNKSVSDITQIVARGIAENKPTYDIAKDLEKYVSPKAAKPWDWSKVYPGVKKQVDYNAQRLARTMINHAYQQSIVEISKTNPFIKGIQWKAAFSKTTCEICEALDGNIFPVNDVPLDHPNGKCTFIAVIDKSSDEIADELAKWVKGEADEDFDKKMIAFAESAGFSKADIE